MNSPSDKTVSATSVDVVYVELDREKDVVAAARAMLSDIERARADRFRRESDAHAWTLAHAALRGVLALWLEREPASFTFDQGENGKPYLPGRELELNLSHAGRWALIALGRDELGVDVERLGRVAASEGVVKLAFGRAERALLDRLPPERRDRIATRLWVRKEALLKGLGTGISGGLRSLDVSAKVEPPGCLRVSAGGMAWTLADLEVDGAHLGALAAQPAAPEVRRWRWNPIERNAERR